MPPPTPTPIPIFAPEARPPPLFPLSLLELVDAGVDVIVAVDINTAEELVAEDPMTVTVDAAGSS